MAAVRKCAECGVGDSANRIGKPGRCVRCINARYAELGWKPLEDFADSQTLRRCACLVCGQVDEVAYAEIRNQHRRYCLPCMCRQMYEQGLAEEPSKWDITIEQAAVLVLGGEFVVRENGEILEAEGLAVRMDHVWSLVDVECFMCGARTRWSASMTLGSRHDPGRSRCFQCLAKPLAAWQDQLFESYGLLRVHGEYAGISEKVTALCVNPDCGEKREISITDLESGVAPCLKCAGALDPDAPHGVYLMRFPKLKIRKIGITNTGARHGRVASHVAHGGVLLEVHQVPNKEAAKTVEDFVMSVVLDFPSGCTAKDFPQGGYTETWSEDAPEVDLGNIVKRLASEEAPGFDRLSKLKAYFASEPLTIEELAAFRHIETIEVAEAEVHLIGLGEPVEQVLRKIRARRASRPEG